MEPTKWSNLPEVVMKTGDKAKYSGVLVPDLNYQNYKTFEKELPEVKKLATVQIIEADNNHAFDDVLWFLGGLVVGIFAVEVTR